jgi:hypothetical protein
MGDSALLRHVPSVVGRFLTRKAGKLARNGKSQQKERETPFD